MSPFRDSGPTAPTGASESLRGTLADHENANNSREIDDFCHNATRCQAESDLEAG